MLTYSKERVEVQSVLNSALTEALRLSEAELGNVQLMDWDAGCLEIASQRGFGDEFLTFFKKVTIDGGSACARALRGREPIIVEDVLSDFAFTSCRTIACSAGFRAVQSTPMVSSSGAFIGILSTHFQSPHRPSDPTMAALKELAGSTANAIVRGRSKMNDVKTTIERSIERMEESYRLLALTDRTTR
ncbi:GAF domain-containing protein [Bradyrhizobium sp. STM 3566]|uniref:GAF domain-containing protein n=1 Tax=Bradyrhizobium sp. STM 3566 TaxID=578928 RepID=UPI00388F35BC